MLWAKIIFWLAYSGILVGVGLAWYGLYKDRANSGKGLFVLTGLLSFVGLFTAGLIVGGLLQ